MKRLIILFVLLLLISASCTVTKRVHRKGWHVEWRNHKSTSSEIIVDQNTRKSDEIQKLSKTETAHQNTVAVSTEASGIESPTISSTQVIDDPSYAASEQVVMDQILLDEITSDKTNDQELVSEENLTKSSKKAIRRSNFFRDLGWGMFLVGLLAGLIGLGFYFWAIAIMSEVLKVILLIFTGIFWLFAAVMIVTGLLIAISAT